jgi:hypothetical protein
MLSPVGDHILQEFNTLYIINSVYMYVYYINYITHVICNTRFYGVCPYIVSIYYAI